MNFNFGEVLTRAWQIVWKHRVLWIFGILASCARGGGGGNGGGSGFSQSGTRQNPPNFDQFGQWMNDHLGLVIGLVILFLILILLFIFLGTVGKIGLIRGTYQAEQGAEQLIFGELFSGSTPYFWRVFGLSFLVGLVFLILFIPIVLFGVFTAGIGFACLLPLICLFIPISIVVNIVIEQANNAMVLENLTIMDGLRRGWDIVKANVGPVILMAIILGVLSFVAGLVIVIPILVTVIPAAFAYAVGNGESRTPLLLAGVCFCIYLPVLLLLQGILIAYMESAWTLTYMRLTSKPDTGASSTPEGNIPPAEPGSNKTLLAGEPKDSDKTVVAKKPDA